MNKRQYFVEIAPKRAISHFPPQFATVSVTWNPSFWFAVKYLREVTPYFRKASIIQEVGWELQRGFLSTTPPPPKSPPRADTRYLPLQLCRLARSHPSLDPGKFFAKYSFIYSFMHHWRTVSIHYTFFIMKKNSIQKKSCNRLLTIHGVHRKNITFLFWKKFNTIILPCRSLEMLKKLVIITKLCNIIISFVMISFFLQLFSPCNNISYDFVQSY